MTETRSLLFAIILVQCDGRKLLLEQLSMKLLLLSRFNLFIKGKSIFPHFTQLFILSRLHCVLHIKRTFNFFFSFLLQFSLLFITLFIIIYSLNFDHHWSTRVTYSTHSTIAIKISVKIILFSPLSTDTTHTLNLNTFKLQGELIHGWCRAG